MNPFKELENIDLLSHAYAIEGGVKSKNLLLQHLGKIGFPNAGNPDVFIRVYESFGIGDSREVVAISSRKPLLSSRNIVVLVTPIITSEAQNALLKTFEEPSASVTFFLITPSFESLLPTLRSRLHLISNTKGEEQESSISIKEFLSSAPSDRLKIVEPLLKERRVGEVINFLSNLEKTLSGLSIKDPKVKEGLESVYRARKYSVDKGALLKTLIEQVVLLTPKVSL